MVNTHPVEFSLIQPRFSGAHSAVDAGGRRPRLLIGLETNVVQQGGFGESLFGDRISLIHAHPPAQEMEQIVGVASQRGISDAMDSLLIQEAVDPSHFSTAVVRHAKRALGVAQSMLLSDNLHGCNHCPVRFRRASPTTRRWASGLRWCWRNHRHRPAPTACQQRSPPPVPGGRR